MAQPNPKRLSLDIDSARVNQRGDASALFHDALKKMDGVIGIGTSEVSTFGHENISSKVASLCEELKSVILLTHPNGTDPRLDIDTDTRDTLVTWLLGDPRGSPFTSQLQKDRDALLQQVQSLERKLEVSRSENESLKTSISEVQRKISGSRSELYYMGHTRTNSTGVIGTGEQTHNGVLESSNQHPGSSVSLQRYTAPPGGGNNVKKQKSLRDSFRKAFSRRKRNSKDFDLENDNALKPLNARAHHFHSLNGPDLADWMSSVGLDMYGEIISQLVGTGERLASIASKTEDLLRLGILNVLHCKKVKLAVEDAIAETPGPLSQLDHHWVANWLKDIGLPQYQQPFMDARIDARMLDNLSMEDLDFLKIDHPFHIISMRRAIQAFRICAYDPNYLKLGQEKGCYKLFHWSVYHLMDWLRDIELDEYADKLQGTGLNGPVIALESTLTHESIAKAIGIAPNKGLLRTHLGDKFVGIIGPIFAQKKVDLMQQKHFMPLDPLQEPPKGKSRSKGSRRSKQNSEETLICPFTEVLPVITKPVRISYIGGKRGAGGSGGSGGSAGSGSSGGRGSGGRRASGVRTKITPEITRNSTISSETGQHRSMAYSPSPLEPTVQPVSISPIPLGHTSSTLNLSPQTNTSTTGPNAAVPPPPPPPPPLPN